MAIGTNRQPVDLISARNRSRNNSEDLPKADYWINVGYTEQNPETGEDVFISIGGISNTSMRQNTGSSDVAQASAALQKAVDELAMALEAGSAELLNLQVQVRRVNEPGHLSDGNPYSKGLKSLKLVG